MEKITVKVAAVREMMQREFQTVGLPQEQAELVADVILDAERSGVLSHGVVRAPVYLKQLRDGIVNPSPDIKIDRCDGVVKVDGDNGLGIIVAEAAMRECIAAAKKNGICAAAIHHSNHFGAAAYYSRLAAAEGCIGFICTMAGPTMAPYGGKELLLGTDPFSVSFPYANDIFTIDISSSAVAKGKIRIYARQGKQIPQGWALDADGNATTDPEKAINGIILPMADHKGYGIALVIEMLSAILSGASLSAESTGMFGVSSEANIGHFALAITISHFLPLIAFESRAGAWLEMLANSKTRADFERILIPGEIENTNREKHELEIELDSDLYNKLFQR